ncbi:hypothetical protein A2853_02155 [Candidatus Kaiserbacteria bacterium RIFCSPHIGHO2_01_FULL_55_17]|uniref:Peptidase A2 domain-containing protein n=1 Tax=Candidatus Kaiserbacteria bacterium RIFCSPHIGHO2_01_FULL_55_17 TaxID=1798484 RepID=A0A1F6D7J8_9BACT|nr:MAG: hypothetical protein A2853_02155 [Candidatus Kaiserbacteria bacterium RIFCSPHIGHO2_01_FULL_55_17]
MRPQVSQQALTIRGNGTLRQLQSDVLVSEPFIGQASPSGVAPASGKFRGIWDTGATGSVITPRVVQQLNLKATGQTQVHTAKGAAVTNTYLVNLLLPSNVGVQNLTVTEGDLPPGDDVLIGMDIITLGDFVITNQQGITVMTFRTPSLAQIDYVQGIKEKNRQKMRNGKRH